MNVDGVQVDIGRVLTRASGVIVADLPRYGGLALASAIVGGLSDTYLPDAGNFLGNIALFFISVLAVYFALQARLADDDIRPRFGAAFGYNLLTSIGIGLGLVFFIIPGLLLFVRWSVGLPALLRENLGVSEAMGRSRDLTEGNRWRILGLALLIWVPFLLVMLLFGSLAGAFGGEAMLGSLAFNMAINFAAGAISVFSALCWTEAYILLSGADRADSALAEIFA